MRIKKKLYDMAYLRIQHILEYDIGYFGLTYSRNILTVGLLITKIVLLMVDHLRYHCLLHHRHRHLLRCYHQHQCHQHQTLLPIQENMPWLCALGAVMVGFSFTLISSMGLNISLLRPTQSELRKTSEKGKFQRKLSTQQMCVSLNKM